VLPCSDVQHRCHVRHTELYCTDEVGYWPYRTIPSVMPIHNRHCACGSNKTVVVHCTLKVANTRRHSQYNAFIYLYWHRATSRKVAGSVVISHSHNPCGRTTALGSTQPLTEMSKARSSRNRPRCPKGFRVVKALDFLDVRHYKGGRSSALRTGRLYPKRNPWYTFSEAESTQGHMVSSGATEKNPQ